MKNNKPIYQYKASTTDSWEPENGRCIWASDLTTKELILPKEDPCAKRMVHIYEKKHDVVPYIRLYIQHQLKGCKDETSESYRVKFPLIQYWKSVADTLEGDFGTSENNEEAGEDSDINLARLSYSFWPRTNHGTGYKNQSQSRDGETRTEEETANEKMEDLVEEFAVEMRG